MNIALIGFGAMGRELQALAPSEHCTVVQVYDENTPLTDADPCNWDVAIDFSTATAVVHNVNVVARAGKGLVIGTTGWYHQLEDVRDVIRAHDIGCVVGTNFSVGVQMLFRLARVAGTLVNGQAEYDVSIHEWHHVHKLDSPSGTALTLGKMLLDEIDRKTHMETETQHGVIDATALHVTSSRVGSVSGKHVITIDGPDDRIELVHDARNRSGFARGALKAARWVANQKGFHDFTDVFTEVIA